MKAEGILDQEEYLLLLGDIVVRVETKAVQGYNTCPCPTRSPSICVTICLFRLLEIGDNNHGLLNKQEVSIGLEPVVGARCSCRWL